MRPEKCSPAQSLGRKGLKNIGLIISQLGEPYYKACLGRWRFGSVLLPTYQLTNQPTNQPSKLLPTYLPTYQLPTNQPTKQSAITARSEPGGTRWHTGGEVKGKLTNGVGSQYSHAISERGLSSITTADAHTTAPSSRLKWCPDRFKWTPPFRWKTKSGFCACAIRFRTSYNIRIVNE